MVQVSNKIPLLADGSVDSEAWMAMLARQYNTEHSAMIKKAIEWAKLHGQGVAAMQAHDCFVAGLLMGALLSELKADYEAVTAAILFELMNQQVLSFEQISDGFNSTVAKLIRDAISMRAVQAMRKEQEDEIQQVEALRKMLLAMINDVRVVLVKLAERTIAMRSLKHLSPAKRKVIAFEVMNLYAPLANRLGIGQIKWELEDRAFANLYPEEYRHITQCLHETRLNREHYLEEIQHRLNQALKEAHLEAEVQGRIKHIYSIWRKMYKKHLDFTELFDIRALRILVKDVASCYAALSCVHHLWQPVASEFDDYISSPKPNGYRSIHTVVIGPEGKTIEVQIRTHAMHEESEMGVAAHWRYKEGAVRDASFENRINWLRNLLEWQKELGAGDENIEALRSKVVDERIYVLTPDGAVIDLPQGATPLDFAYHIHTEVGHRCRGAKVNGKMVPLTHTLQTTDQVEIITGKESKPSRDWLGRQEKYIVSPRAREKIQYYFRQEHRALNIQAGKEILQKELQRYRLKAEDHEWLAKACHLQSVEELYAAIGLGDIGLQHLIQLLESRISPKESAPEATSIPIKKTATTHKPTDLLIQGVDNLLSRTAGCCRPVVGDEVIGYITQGRGVSVHRTDCNNIAHIRSRTPDRLIEVKWGNTHGRAYPVSLSVFALNQAHLLRDFTALFSNEKLAVLSLNTQLNKGRNTQLIQLVIEVIDLKQLNHVQRLISEMPGVLEVRRSS